MSLPGVCAVCFEFIEPSDHAVGVDTLSESRVHGTWDLHSGECASKAGIVED